MMAVASRRMTECFWLLLGAVALWFLMAHPALAQASGGWGNFSCSNGQASGTLYDPGNTCPTTIKFDNIFSFLVCNMEHLSANLMGSMYCGIVDTAVPAVEAALTLAVVIFGVGFTTGVIPATAREFQLFMVKIAFVWVFATQADYMIGIGYRFFVEGAREGIMIALSGVFEKEGGGQATGADLYLYLDKFLGKALEYASANVGMDWDDPEQDPCKNAIFSVIAMMMIIFPPLFYVAVGLMFKVGLTFLRAVFGYIYALVGLVFLISMAPLFLTFQLFRQTQPFFNKWVGYLVSFSLQMVIVFAFLGAIVSIDVSHITSSFTNIIMRNQQDVETTSFRFPWEYCTICDFEVVNTETGDVIPDSAYKDTLERGSLRCKTPQHAISPTETFAPQPGPGGASPPPSGGAAQTDTIRNSLLKFTASALLSLFVLAYVVDKLLTLVPQLAQNLASGLGGMYAPQLGGSEGVAGGRAVAEMPGNRILGTVERGFTDGYIHATGEGGLSATTPGAIIGGFKEASTRLLFGGYTRTDVVNRASGAESYKDPGLVDSFFNFFINPQGDTPAQ